MFCGPCRFGGCVAAEGLHAGRSVQNAVLFVLCPQLLQVTPGPFGAMPQSGHSVGEGYLLAIVRENAKHPPV